MYIRNGLILSIAAMGIVVVVVMKVRTPEDVNAKALDVALYSVENRPMIEAVIEALQKQDEDPADFFVQVHLPSIESVVRVSLWHEDAFSLWHYRDSGNPGGKCRDMYFDRGTEKITKTLFWK